jgi:pSer/pThr/pTyr-binding forkhead associated (FHA) protein
VAFSLVLVKEDGSTKDIPLSRSRIVGREEECDLRIPAATVSREHCEIVVEAGEPPRVKDLASSNGTYLNGSPVDEAELKAGDILSIGPANFVVRIDGRPAAIDRSAVEAAAQKALSASAAEEANRTPAPTTRRPSLLEDESDEDIAKALDAEASGIDDFDFSLDDEDEQPPL